MNIFAKFDENPAMTQVIKKTERCGRTHAWTDGRTDNVKTVYPTTNKVCGGGGIINSIIHEHKCEILYIIEH